MWLKYQPSVWAWRWLRGPENQAVDTAELLPPMQLAPKSWADPAMHRGTHTGDEPPFLLSCWATCLYKFPLPGVSSASGPRLTQTSEALHAQSNVHYRITKTGWDMSEALWRVCARWAEEGWMRSCLRSNLICGKANLLNSAKRQLLLLQPQVT